MDKIKNSYWIYVLKCQDNKWYVGRTSKTPTIRFQEHVNNIRSAAWTRKYKPIKLVDSVFLGAVADERAQRAENRATIRYIKKYGIDNVRGGDLNSTQKYKTALGYYFNEFEWEAYKVILYYVVLSTVFLVMYLTK